MADRLTTSPFRIGNLLFGIRNGTTPFDAGQAPVRADRGLDRKRPVARECKSPAPGIGPDWRSKMGAINFQNGAFPTAVSRGLCPYQLSQSAQRQRRARPGRGLVIPYLHQPT
jgi:hypothetical protein